VNAVLQNGKLKYLIAGGIGAVFGGVVMAVASKAIPKMMAEMSNSMMTMMMEKMQSEGCSPA
jgi:hypothetical protein